MRLLQNLLGLSDCGSEDQIGQHAFGRFTEFGFMTGRVPTSLKTLAMMRGGTIADAAITRLCEGDKFGRKRCATKFFGDFKAVWTRAVHAWAVCVPLPAVLR